MRETACRGRITAYSASDSRLASLLPLVRPLPGLFAAAYISGRLDKARQSRAWAAQRLDCGPQGCGDWGETRTGWPAGAAPVDGGGTKITRFHGVSRRAVFAVLATQAPVRRSRSPSAAPAATVAFANPSGISIPTSGNATPYPSTIAVSGFVGPLTDVNGRAAGRPTGRTTRLAYCSSDRGACSTTASHAHSRSRPCRSCRR